jgi:hypothetical protein
MIACIAFPLGVHLGREGRCREGLGICLGIGLAPYGRESRAGFLLDAVRHRKHHHWFES